MNRLICRRVFIFLVCLAFVSWTEALANTLDHWQWRSPLPQGNKLNSMVLGNNTIVAVGDAGTIITSTDGIVGRYGQRRLPTTSMG